MTTEAQLYLNEQTTERRFAEELAAKDAEIAALREALFWITSANAGVTDADYRTIAMQFAIAALNPGS